MTAARPRRTRTPAAAGGPGNRAPVDAPQETLESDLDGLRRELAARDAQLAARDRDLADTRDQQTATGDILRVIATSRTGVEAVFDAICRSAARLCDATDAAIFQLEGDVVRNVFRHGPAQGRRPVGGAVPMSDLRPNVGRLPVHVIAARKTIHIPDVTIHTGASDTTEFVGRYGIRSRLGAPLMREGRAIGSLVVDRTEPRPFTDQQITLLETFADQAVIAIENARLFQELQASNRTLTEALEQQTATADVLRVIASSPTDLQSVLDSIAASAARLCDAYDAAVMRVDGDALVRAAHIGPHPITPADERIPITRGSVNGRAVVDRQTLHIADMETLSDVEYPVGVALYRRTGTRCVVSTPLLREGVPIGTINVRRVEARPFTDEQIKLLETFADQAVIAIENTRLFTELQERDDRRRQELERASAIQQRLLPDNVQGWPGVLEIAVRFRPAVETSGDFYDVLPLASATKDGLEPLQIAVGDVAGKGMAAALVTALARAALHSSASVPNGMATPAATLRVAGQRLNRDVGGQHFVACALAIIEPPGYHNRGPLLRLSNAAQVPVLLVRASAASELTPPGYCLPLGAEPDGAYRDTEVELQLGDVVVFSSDGLVEAPALAAAAVVHHLPPAENPSELFGFARLASSCAHWSTHATTAEAVAEGIWSDLTAWCGSESHHDDMTFLALRVTS